MSDEFQRPSGDAITDRKRQRAAEAQRQAHSLHRLVRPFLPGNTKDWRQRSAIIDALNNIRDLADESSRCLDDVRNVKQAAAALKDMESHLVVLWPGMGWNKTMKAKSTSKSPKAPTERAKPRSVQRLVRVRSRTMLTAYKRVVMAIAHLNDDERRRVLGAAAIICGEHPNSKLTNPAAE